MKELPLQAIIVLSLCVGIGCGGSALKSSKSASQPAASQPATQPLEQAHPPVHKLTNGMTAIVQEMPGVQVATADVWIATGSANEPPELAGVSHFLEHMMFKGTEMHGPGEMDQLVEGVGGILNAGTSKDFTHYYMTVPAAEIHTAIDSLGDAVTSSTLILPEFDKERGVILEEISRKDDSPFGFLVEKLYENGYASGPYRHSVLGQSATIRAVTQESMLAYYKHYYTPANTLLVVAGDVKTEDILHRAESAFSRFNPSSTPLPNTLQPAEWNSGADITIPKDVREAYVAVAFPAPSIQEPDALYAADVLQTLLSDGNASRLNRELKERRGLVSSISATYPTHRHDSLFAIFAVLPPQNIAEYRKALMDELERARDRKFDGDALHRAKKLMINSHYFSKETTGGAASSIGYYYTLTGSPEFEKSYVEKISAIEAKDVQQSARRIFDPEKAVWLTLHPTAEF